MSMRDDLSGERPDEAKDWERLARYLAGECPADEADVVRRQLLENPGAAELFRLLRESRSTAGQGAAELDVEGALRKVKGRVAAGEGRQQWPRHRWRAIGLAAAAVVVLAATTLFSLGRERSREGEPTVGRGRTYAARVGARDSVLLPDGSRVLLGPGSTLVLAADYGTASRDVAVVGEAYFDVRHDATHPFTVHAGPATIRDVGTSFAVHDDPRGAVRVAVTSGAVLLRSSSRSDSGVVLHAGDAGGVADGAAVAQPGSATADDLAWTRGRLVFRDTPLSDVAADLRRWYGVQLLVADSALAGRHLTATFSGEPAAHVVQVIALTLGAQVQWQGDTAVMRR